MSRRGAWAITVVVVIATLFSASRMSSTSLPGPWRAVSPAPVESRASYASAVAGDQVMIWGGYAGFAKRHVADGALFDLKRWTWKRMAPSPIRPCSLAEAGVIGDRVLVIAGDQGEGPVDADGFPDVAWYDPDQDRWEKVGDCPITNRWRHFAWTQDGVAVWREPGERGDFAGFFFEAKSGAWTEMKPHPAVTVKHPAYAVIGNKIYFWGGIREETARSTGAVFDVEKNSWMPMSASPLSPRYFSRAFEMGDKILFWSGIRQGDGGWNPSKRRPLIDDMDGAVFDSVTDSWTLLPPSPRLGESWNARDLNDRTFLVWGEEGLATYQLGEASWKSLPDPGILRMTFGHRIHAAGSWRVLSFFTHEGGGSRHHIGPVYDSLLQKWIPTPDVRNTRDWVPTPRGMLFWGAREGAEKDNSGAFLKVGP